jgi:hypothetical protein
VLLPLSPSRPPTDPPKLEEDPLEVPACRVAARLGEGDDRSCGAASVAKTKLVWLLLPAKVVSTR